MSRFSQDRLKSLFCPRAKVPEMQGIRGVRVPTPVYDAYVETYRRSRAMAAALKAVLNDGEHQLAMIEADAAGHDLPDLALFGAELDAYQDFLKSFDPYDAVFAWEGEVHLPPPTARNLLAMVHYNSLMLSRVLGGVFETGYLKHFRTLKEDGIPYAGPTALQEAVHLMAGLVYAHGQIERHPLRPLGAKARTAASAGPSAG